MTVRPGTRTSPVEATTASIGRNGAGGQDLMTAEVVQRYAAPVPRYTSYPTAPYFTPAVDADVYRRWLAALPEGARLSLYCHVPFCSVLCWYCGCNTKETRSYEPIAAYLEALLSEIAHVGPLMPKRHGIAHLHWGGGSPNVLTAPDIRRLAGALKDAFHFEPDAEFAVEVDPRGMAEDQARVTAFAESGVNRVSLGVQDFAEDVQKAINRIQSFQMTKDVLTRFREAGVKGVNIDLVYGLPHQTPDSVERTIRQVIELAPDRLAVFGYAHIPSRLKHQRLIADADLPGIMSRYEQAGRISRTLQDAGYVRVGLDHFAKPTDPLAAGTVNRNFQGYTTDEAEILIGLGASSIGKLPQGYVQNQVAAGDYARRVAEKGIAVVRGVELSEEDRLRAHVIERLMCDLTFERADVTRRFGVLAAPVIAEADALLAADQDDLVERTADGFRVTERGRPFVRSLASRFDAYLGKSAAKHSSGV